MTEETNSVVEKTQEEQINQILSKIDNKDFSFYFFTLDTLGNPVAGVANIYEHVKVLNELGTDKKRLLFKTKVEYVEQNKLIGHGIRKKMQISILL